MTEEATNPVADDDSRVIESEGVQQADHTEAADEGEEVEGEEPEDEAEPEEEYEEVERGEVKYRIPKALKGEFLMQADYTRKTQELSQQRQQHEAAVQQWTEADEALVEARAGLKAIDTRLQQIESLTEGQWQQLDPARAQALMREQMTLRDQRAQLDGAVAQHRERLEADRTRLATERRQAFAEALPREIPGWSDELDAKLTKAAIDDLGFQPDDLKNLDDIRAAKTLYWAHRGLEAHRAEQAALKAQKTVSVQPAPKVAGGQAPRRELRDDLSVDEWMRRRSTKPSR